MVYSSSHLPRDVALLADLFCYSNLRMHLVAQLRNIPNNTNASALLVHEGPIIIH
jgi:hypothetical protein